MKHRRIRLAPTHARIALTILLAGATLALGSASVRASTVTFHQTNLVSDIQGLALHTDASLVNPWGISSGPSTPFWVSDNGKGVTTLYNTSGQSVRKPVTIPPPAGSMPGTNATPTGQVFNGTPNFVVSENGKSGPSLFIFATEDGTISGWNFGVDPDNAILAVDNSASRAVYKGIAMGSTASGTFLYAANFRAGAVDVFDSSFHPAHLPGSFKDPLVPAGYAPFNVQNVGGRLYVTFAKQDANKHDDVAGPGHGYVDIFDTNGFLHQRLTPHNFFNSPWGVAVAPSTFGRFAGDVLIGNFGNGRISAFDPVHGSFRGQLAATSGQPLSIEGLWGLRVGNGGNGGDPGTLYFTAGINHEADGLFGSLHP